MSNEFFEVILTSSKNIGAGAATVGLAGAGAGIGAVLALITYMYTSKEVEEIQDTSNQRSGDTEENS